LLDGGWDLHLDIVGEDTLDGQIQSLARRLKIEARVCFHGFLTQTQLRPIMEMAHILVVTSRHEAGPVVVLEAALSGVPTVGTAVGHIAEWSPTAARATAVGDVAGLARLIGELLSREDERLKLASAAQRLAMQEDADHTARCFAELYATLGRS
jgi:glycosyltransferase involved in cell wall biosynthesis